MPYWELFYHIVWSTKNREPRLAPEIAPLVYGFLKAKAIGLEATVFAINGMDDHVHLVAAIPPKIAVASFIGRIKAVASTKVNKLDATRIPFYWQAEYGVFSFDKKRLPYHVAYVERQEEHHKQRTTIAAFERTSVPGIH
jgi:putative transposase